MKKGGELVLLRHGESLWNQANRFTGWVDVPLSSKGIEEALQVGKQMANISFDYVFVSNLTRAQQTAYLALSENLSKKTPYIVHDHSWYFPPTDRKRNMLPITVVEALNERYYGDLQGLDKDETRAKYGSDQVHVWRRSYDISPPHGESLDQCAQRTLPWFRKEVVPLLRQKEKVFIAAHGNSLRAIVMAIRNLSHEEIVRLEIGTGEPICFHYIEDGWVEGLL